MGRARAPQCWMRRELARALLAGLLCAAALPRFAPQAWAAGHQPLRLPGPASLRELATGRRLVQRRVFEEDVAPEDAAELLQEETRLLRETQEVLIQELRLLRQALQGTDAAAPAAQAPPAPPAPAPAAPAVPMPAPAPAPLPVPPPVVPPPQPPAPVFPVPAPAPPRAVAPPSAPAASAPAPSATPGKTKVKVISAGHATGNVADFFLDEQQVPVSIGPAARRGLNVVVVDPNAGRILSARCYDIWGSAIDENKRLTRDLKSLPEGHVVLVALKDSGMENIDNSALGALRECGSTLEGRLPEREGYALIGSKGGEAIAERTSDRMIMLEASLPFQLQSRLSSWSPPPRPAAPAPAAPAPPAQAASPFPPPQQPPMTPPRPQPAAQAAAAGSADPERPVAMLEEIQERIRKKRLGQS